MVINGHRNTVGQSVAGDLKSDLHLNLMKLRELTGCSWGRRCPRERQRRKALKRGGEEGGGAEEVGKGGEQSSSYRKGQRRTVDGGEERLQAK